jgi:ectoine hydroxylase-related dioxygenase (phytanoyl-CoA dioxygenase family)
MIAAQPRIDAQDLADSLRVLAPDERAFAEAMARDGAATIDLDADALAVCDRAVAETDPMFDGDRKSRVPDAWRRSRAVRRLACRPEIRRLLRAAYGREPFAFQTLSFRRGTEQALHSDTIHFNSEPAGFMCGVWIALEDVDPRSGPLLYQPGSHRLPVLNMRDVGVNGSPVVADYDRCYEPRFRQQLDAAGLPTQSLLLRKGQAFAWAANLAHGGAPIEDPGLTRRSLVVHFYFKDAVYYTPRLSDEPAGQLHMRLPANIGAGLWVWPRRNGRRVPVPPARVLAAVKARILGPSNP